MTTIQIMRSVGRNIRKARLKSGMSKREIHESTGMSRAFYNEVESGEQLPSLASLNRIAEALGVIVADLLPEDFLHKNGNGVKP